MASYDYSARVMGCDFDVTIVADDESVADAAYIHAAQIAADYEQTFSRFHPTSELAILNTAKELAPPSERFFRVMCCARDCVAATAGAYNPLIRIAAHGYDTTFDRIAKRKNDIRTVPVDTNFAAVTITRTRIALMPHQNIDLAGMLKGYVTARIADTLMQTYALRGVVIDIGGDMTTRGVAADNAPFAIDIVNPHPGAPDIPVALHNTTLCTSGTYRRRWRTTHGMRHHILDPNTHANPDTNIISASIMIRNGALADALATAAITLGTANARALLDAHQCTYTLITHNGAVTTTMA